MKKITKSNPLKFFNDNKSIAYKKAGGQMSTYKVKLKKAQNGGFKDSTIPFVESKDKTYTNVTYTKNPSYSDKDSEMGCGTSIQVPGCDKYGNAGKFRNFSKKLKTIEIPTRINIPYQELKY